ncbi:Cytochrome P450 2L1-like 2 [Homarus americanus]|uniref:Cytochrome P450 2L1-like 2 n=1 Tax=Homarus americanus TaxID=6706 RepID=A0A8J5JSB5_HOMAM|nr:Cytochrome P450 2L1-like 2 [Homarus americanus]
MDRSIFGVRARMRDIFNQLNNELGAISIIGSLENRGTHDAFWSLTQTLTLNRSKLSECWDGEQGKGEVPEATASVGSDVGGGPRRYPIIGTIPVTTAKQVEELRQKYGDIIRVNADSVCATSCGYEGRYESRTLCRMLDRGVEGQEGRLQQLFGVIGRTSWRLSSKCLIPLAQKEKRQTILTNLAHGAKGVIFRSGPSWLTLRRFFLRHLRDMGMGKTRMDDVILTEAQELVDDIRNYTEKPTHFPPPSLKIAILNVIWQLVASRRYNIHDEEISEFAGFISSFQDDLAIMVLFDIFPWLNYLPSAIRRRLVNEDKLDCGVKKANKLMKEIIEDHKSSLEPSSPRDVIDEYLLEMEAQQDNPDSVFTELDLRKGIFDLFAAGFDTASNMILWVCLHMADKPHVQQRIQQEMDEVVPLDTLPSHQHRSQLPYLDATLHEVHRVASLASTGVPHCAAQDMYLGGYLIPRGTMVSGSIASCHSDPQYWDHPEEFRPERFLDESGKLNVPKDGFLPFGVGKRRCLGEALAKMELFSFSAALLQNFTFSPLENSKVDLDYRPLPNQQFPKPQDLVITVRNVGGVSGAGNCLAALGGAVIASGNAGGAGGCRWCW